MTIIATAVIAQQLAAAGLAGLPFTWGSDGAIAYDPSITPAQRTAIEAVFAAYDPVAALKADLAERIAASRYALETGGITIAGMAVRTDRESQSMIASALQIVTRNPAALIDWKGATGWAQLDKTAIEAIADAVGAHVQACFTAERARHEALAALSTPEQLAAFDPAVVIQS